ncbi:hypothetical protein C8250_008910 [Streptomyces sp. So13.3]|uniref:hypothetical protein n=1 Tax=Streptomyces sp. So13.3 TaxID=2136173 RepID=UPI00164D8F5A|nr:hypothetical protein [Streptomyces sp. So13.3]QNA72004.1 hypothetical protein C8250_008910 [Streptomyces sp. So13.3]
MPRWAPVTACDDIDAHVVQSRAMRSFLDKCPEVATSRAVPGAAGSVVAGRRACGAADWGREGAVAARAARGAVRRAGAACGRGACGAACSAGGKSGRRPRLPHADLE